MNRPLVLEEVPVDLLTYVDDDPRALQAVSRIDWRRLPRHVAVIMDGNGRWARTRSLPRIEGHRSAITAVRETVETCARAGVEALTLYAFSRENWRRPPREVEALMGLLRRWLARELARIHSEGLRFRVLGRMDELPAPVQAELRDAVALTADNAGMDLGIALSYGGRTEIIDAARAAIADALGGRLHPEELDEASFADYLYTAGLPDPDLVIRTSGELRVSNFLLYQIAYAEFVTTSTLWPDFRRADLLEALVAFQDRERRYGGVTAGERP